MFCSALPPCFRQARAAARGAQPASTAPQNRRAEGAAAGQHGHRQASRRYHRPEAQGPPLVQPRRERRRERRWCWCSGQGRTRWSCTCSSCKCRQGRCSGHPDRPRCGHWTRQKPLLGQHRRLERRWSRRFPCCRSPPHGRRKQDHRIEPPHGRHREPDQSQSCSPAHSQSFDALLKAPENA